MGHRRQCKLTEGSLLPSTERPHLGVGAQGTLPLRRGGLGYLTIPERCIQMLRVSVFSLYKKLFEKPCQEICSRLNFKTASEHS